MTMNRRLFFAFWPDAATLAALTAARAQLFPLAGRPVEPAMLHVTAAFLGAVNESRHGALLELAQRQDAGCVQIDRLEHWPKAQALVACSSQPNAAAHACIDQLWRRLDRLGFAREPRPWVPHVTLARAVTRARAQRQAWQPVSFPLQRLMLVESVPEPGGSRYVPLTGTAPP